MHTLNAKKTRRSQNCIKMDEILTASSKELSWLPFSSIGGLDKRSFTILFIKQSLTYRHWIIGKISLINNNCLVQEKALFSSLCTPNEENLMEGDYMGQEQSR